MEKIFIEDYKGHSIYYSEGNDKFHCDIELNGNTKSSKRGSLKDLRKEIDLFIKENLNFKPFEFLAKDCNSYKRIICESIRTDGSFVWRNPKYTKYAEYKSIKDFTGALEYDKSILDEIDLFEATKKKVINECDLKIKELYQSIKPLDISKYGSIFYKTGE